MNEKEFVTIDGITYATENVSTGLDTISFSITEMAIEKALETFKPATELSVSKDGEEPHGVYANLKFASATVDADRLVTVTFRIASDMEKRMENIETSMSVLADGLADMSEQVFAD